jgi:ATP-dependent Clp protease ATP-binding subunit ClpC
VLLDELEKAHGDVLNILLQILEDGMLTDGKGRTVNFKNTILVMTSNVGSRRIMELSRLEDDLDAGDIEEGITSRKSRKKHRASLQASPDDEEVEQKRDAMYTKLSEVVKEELEGEMRPEFLNRIDEIVVFSPLCEKDLTSIVDLILQKTVQRARKEHDMQLSIGPSLAKMIMEEGSSNAAQFGARPMRRAAQRFFEDAISDAIVRAFLQSGDEAVVDLAVDSGSSARSKRAYMVEITRSRDGKSIQVPVEKVSGGIGASMPTSVVRPNGDTELLQAESAVSQP